MINGILANLKVICKILLIIVFIGSIIVGVIVSLALPFCIPKNFYYNNNWYLFLISFITFILASIFPISGIAYILFQGESRRRKLAKDFWLLSIRVDGDLEQKDLNKIVKRFRQRYSQKYGKNIEETDVSSENWDIEAYCEYFNIIKEKSNSDWNYIIQSLIPIVVTNLGVNLLFIQNLPYELFNDYNRDYLTIMKAGFIGGYIFSVQLIYRRYTSFDLKPYVYMACTLAMISGILFSFIASPLILSLFGNNSNNGDYQIQNGIIYILGFSLGYFPYLAIRWFNQIAYRALQINEYQSNSLPLNILDGISQFHETRLHDEGIDNIENLASAPIDDLLVNTYFSASRIIGWIDQAILYVYLETNEIQNFRRGGIRNFSDFREYWGPCFKAYYALANPTIKLIEIFRHLDITEDKIKSFSGLTKDEFIKQCQDLIYQWEIDNIEIEMIHHLLKTLQQTKNSENLFNQLDDYRQKLALELRSTPEHLDLLYISTRLGPNVAYVKHYWRILEKIGNASYNEKFKRQTLNSN
ncbi:hypothetical protein [Cyanothece sp. BG0011]|uniref:hypothetical protein n=1 Tax=Cyanothece sp. BG0011 TaxID=2082950 RepID=UPI001300293B|nr:hypothetical protein [Cyanothece sp. BG0011]